MDLNCLFGVEGFGCVLALILCGLVALYAKHGFESKKYPPGPVGLPIFGYLPFLTNRPHLKLQELSKTYGDIFSLKLGAKNVIVLSSPELIKEVMCQQEAMGRPEMYDMKMATLETPMLESGKLWQEHRQFFLKALRDLGLNKPKMYELIMEEVQCFLQPLNDYKGAAMDFHNHLSTSISRIIYVLLFRKEEENIKQFIDNFMHSVEKYTLQTLPVYYFPWLPYFLWLRLFQKLFGVKGLVDAGTGLKRIFTEKIERCKRSLDPNNPDDFVDMYLSELKSKENAKANTTLSESYITATVVDIFNAGTETTRSILSWLLYILALYPDEQKKMQEEIDRVVGKNRPPSFTDSTSMPYNRAVIAESERWKTSSPFGLFRRLLEDAEIRGYKIPKGTLIFPNFWAAHFKPEMGKNPEQFLPERFLSPDGKSFEKPECFNIFSFGKRSCPGEGFSTAMIFLYTTSILQKFTIEFPKGLQQRFDTEMSSIFQLKPYKLCFVPRE